MYTIGQVSEMFDLPISTLRYYDKEGLFPTIQRDSGIRKFGEKELEALRVIECLKNRLLFIEKRAASGRTQAAALYINGKGG